MPKGNFFFIKKKRNKKKSRVDNNNIKANEIAKDYTEGIEREREKITKHKHSQRAILIQTLQTEGKI